MPSDEIAEMEDPPVKVLIVDDREENLLVLGSILSDLDVELIEARSGAEALEQLLAHDVAVALIDVQMPEIDGFELAELIRGTNRTSRVPIIFVTAGAFERNRVFRGYEAGAVDFLFKPLVPHILKGKVQIFAELHRQRMRLATMVHLREELVAIVSHDLRNPLNSIVMCAGLITELSETPQVTGAAERITRSATRMASIIDDLLDLSRSRLGGGVPITSAACDLGSIANFAVDELATSGRQINVFVSGQLNGTWDGARLGQLISNLVANALEHGAPGTPVTLMLDGEQPNDVFLRVHNQGVIPPEHRALLFQPYVSRGKNSGRKGLGLGLYIVGQIAKAHRGEVTVVSNDDSGTTFTLRLSRHC